MYRGFEIRALLNSGLGPNLQGNISSVYEGHARYQASYIHRTRNSVAQRVFVRLLGTEHLYITSRPYVYLCLVLFYVQRVKRALVEGGTDESSTLR